MSTGAKEATDRTLLLLRHSKAEQVPGKRDFDRALTPRGRRDAAAAGGWLADESLVADLVLSSTSMRTRQTWEHAEAGGAEAAEVRFDDRLYNASVGTLLEVLHGAPDAARVLLVIGHGPGIPWLASALASKVGGHSELLDEMEDGFPTTGLAVLRCSRPWSGLGRGKASLEDFVVPRG